MDGCPILFGAVSAYFQGAKSCEFQGGEASPRAELPWPLLLHPPFCEPPELPAFFETLLQLIKKLQEDQ